MVFSDVPFAAIRKLLLGLGFIEKALPPDDTHDVPGIVFGHLPSRAVFEFPAYRPKDRVSMADLVMVRRQFDWRGVMSEEAFDAALRKASA
ncbi:MAG TPA: hypothetical protein VFW33_23885 [Gemmataceae bacterium]|nr:hypothetical protein [Gemmataceae bacterium]